METVIFDIDGTLADASRRQHWVSFKPHQFDAFFADIENDPVILPVKRMITVMANAGYKLVVSTGRAEKYREGTLRWLEKNGMGFDFDDYWFRKQGDYRDDAIVKYEMLLEMRAKGYNPVYAFEDRKQVVDLWVREGIFCFDVSQGNGDF